MEDTKILLRNWKIIWTILAIVASLFVLYISFKLNAPFNEIEINIIKNGYGDSITDIIIGADHDLLDTLFFGTFFALLWNILQIPIWLLWKIFV